MKYRGKEKEYHQEYYQRRRQERIEYLGGRCVQCGTTEKLEFDHIDPSLKEYSISENNFEIERIKEELDKCQLLCRKHHAEKTARENSARFTKTGDEIQHGIIATWMRRKCKCDVCLEAKRRYNNERNFKRRNKSKQNGKIKDKTHCKNNHLLNEENLAVIKRTNGYTEYKCRTCHRNTERNRRK